MLGEESSEEDFKNISEDGSDDKQGGNGDYVFHTGLLYGF